jgi:hypothetical protein
MARHRYVAVALVASSLLLASVALHGGGLGRWGGSTAGGSGGQGGALDAPTARRALQLHGAGGGLVGATGGGGGGGGGAATGSPGWHPKRFEHSTTEGRLAPRSASGAAADTGDEDADASASTARTSVPAATAAAADSASTSAVDSALARSQRRALTPAELAKLKALDPETFAAVPPAAGEWNDQLKNPCWSDPSGRAFPECSFR